MRRVRFAMSGAFPVDGGFAINLCCVTAAELVGALPVGS